MKDDVVMKLLREVKAGKVSVEDARDALSEVLGVEGVGLGWKGCHEAHHAAPWGARGKPRALPEALRCSRMMEMVCKHGLFYLFIIIFMDMSAQKSR